MVTFEEAAAMLDEAVDALPQEIFNKLNGGVNLLPARRTDENGLLVMGMYFVDQMGRHVEIYLRLLPGALRRRRSRALAPGADAHAQTRADAPHRKPGL